MYLISYASYSAGSPSYDNTATESTGSFNTQGFVSSAMFGSVIALSDNLKVDLRGGFVYALQKADDYKDIDGLKYSNSNVLDNSARVSLKLFTLHQYDEIKLRPFFQIGLSDRLSYTNETYVDGDRYKFSDDGEHVFGRIGVDVELNNGVQSYFAIGGDTSNDQKSISAQFGITIKMDN